MVRHNNRIWNSETNDNTKEDQFAVIVLLPVGSTIAVYRKDFLTVEAKTEEQEASIKTKFTASRETGAAVRHWAEHFWRVKLKQTEFAVSQTQTPILQIWDQDLWTRVLLPQFCSFLSLHFIYHPGVTQTDNSELQGLKPEGSMIPDAFKNHPQNYETDVS